MDSVTADCLVQLGFSPTESKVYCTMVSEEKMNGYQVAKALGMSRSSVYSALENLLEKGAIVSIPGNTSEYAVIEPAQLIEKIITKYRMNAEAARNTLESISLKRRASNYFCNIQGKQNLIDEIKAMISASRKELVINSSMEIKYFINEIKAAKDRGVRVVLFSWINLELYDLDVEFYCNNVNIDHVNDKRFAMVVDNVSCIICSNDRNEFLTFEKMRELGDDLDLTSEDKDFLGMKSDNRLFVSMIQEHIHFDIYLNKLRIKHGGEIITPDILINSMMENGN